MRNCISKLKSKKKACESEPQSNKFTGIINNPPNKKAKKFSASSIVMKGLDLLNFTVAEPVYIFKEATWTLLHHSLHVCLST
jgi:hypothetical protein